MRIPRSPSAESAPLPSPPSSPSSELVETVRSLTEAAEGRDVVPERTAEEWSRLYSAAIEALLGATAWPGLEGHPRLLVHRMALATLASGRHPQRGALEKELLVLLSRNVRARNDRILLLRAIAIVGGEECVAPLERLVRGDEDPPIRVYALRALEANPTRAAESAIVGFLGDSEETGALVAFLEALGSRGSLGPEALVEVERLTGASDLAVAEAAVGVLGASASPSSRVLLARLRAAGRAELRGAVARASVSVGYRFLARGDGKSAAEVFRADFDTAPGGIEMLAALRGLILAAPAEGVARMIETLALPRAPSRLDLLPRAATAHLAGEVRDEGARRVLEEAAPRMEDSVARIVREALAEAKG